MFPADGSTTASAKAVAMAASTAFPPRFKMPTPTRDANSLTDTTMARRARTGSDSFAEPLLALRTVATTNAHRTNRRASAASPLQRENHEGSLGRLAGGPISQPLGRRNNGRGGVCSRCCRDRTETRLMPAQRCAESRNALSRLPQEQEYAAIDEACGAAWRRRTLPGRCLQIQLYRVLPRLPVSAELRRGSPEAGTAG